MCAKATKATPEQLRAEIEKLISAFGIDAAFLGINSDNPIPDDPTPKILALFATFLASIELPDKSSINKQMWVGSSGYPFPPVKEVEAFNEAIDQCQAILTRIAEELTK